MVAVASGNIREIISLTDLLESWDWLYSLISIDRQFIEEHGYYFDHKHLVLADSQKCIDEYEEADKFIARLYLVSQLSSVTDYMSVILRKNNNYSLVLSSNLLDDDIA